MVMNNKIINEYTIPVPWGHIAVKTWGSHDNSPVLMVHGIQDNAGSFDRLLQYLPNQFFYVTLDLPGHGKSSHYPPGLIDGLQPLLHAVRRVVEYLGWKTFIYIGHSLGGRTGLHYRAIYPDEVTKLVMLDMIDHENVDPSEYSSWFQSEHTRFIHIESKMKTGKPPRYTMEQLLDMYKGNRNIKTEAARDLLSRCTTLNEDGSYSLTMDQRLKCRHLEPMDASYRVVALAPAKPVPHLIIFASESVKAGIKRFQWKLLNALRKNRLFEEYDVEGNHDVHLNSPEIVGPIIERFLIKHKSSL